MSHSQKPQNKTRKSLSIGDKLEIIREIQGGKTQTCVAKEKYLAISTVQKIYSEREKIRANSQNFNVTSKRARPSSFPVVDAALTKYFDLTRENSIPLSGPLVAEKAKEIAEKCGIEDFKGTKNWVTGWKKRHSIKFYSVAGEAGSVDENVVNNWVENEWPRIRKDFRDEDIFNADESALFFKLLPNKTLNRKGRKCIGGKLSKERVTFMLCANMTGTEKIKPLVIGKSENPRCFKSIKKQSLPVYYYSNKKARMTRELFSDWIRKLDLKMRFAKRKILLLLDNCSSHTNLTVKTPNITIAYFPAGTTSKLQPMDQGIINETKKLYKKILLRRILREIEDANFKTSPVGINILDAILILSRSWNQLKESTIMSGFKTAKLHIALEQEEVQEEVLELEEDITVDSLDSSSLNKMGVTDELLEEYFSVDSNLMTEEIPTVDEVLETLDVERSDNDSESEESEEEPEIILPEISSAVVAQHLESLKYWLMNQENGDLHFPAVHKLEEFVQKTRIQSLKQREITEYFSSE